jgi:hypothetical protein
MQNYTGIIVISPIIILYFKQTIKQPVTRFVKFYLKTRRGFARWCGNMVGDLGLGVTDEVGRFSASIVA